MLRALTVVVLGASACGLGKKPQPPAVCVPPSLARLQYRPDGAPDLFAGLALDMPRATRIVRRQPRAFVRTGDRTSAPAIARARLAVDARDCRSVRRAAGALPAAHADRDYVAYLEAWCHHLAGNHAAARDGLIGLATASADDQLRASIDEDLLEVLVAGDVEGGLEALAQTRLSAEQYALALFDAGKQVEGALVVRRTAGPMPEAAELACRWKVAECRRTIAAHVSWGLIWPTCTDPLAVRPDSVCGEAEPLTELAALYAWRGDNLGSVYEGAFRAAIERWLAPSMQHRGFDFAGRDRLALAMLASNWGNIEPTSAAWNLMYVLATRIYDRTTDPGVARAAQAVSATAHHNALALEKLERCREAREASRD